MGQQSPDRRAFLKTALASVPLVFTSRDEIKSLASGKVEKPLPVRLSCNLYSFNEPLSKGQISLEQVLNFCADLGFAAVDPTAYYFPNYPNLPEDDYVNTIKRKAFRLGLAISGTGVRNDFTLPDFSRRKAEVELVKKWLGFASRLGAPVLRIFAGTGKELQAGYNREQVEKWVVDAIVECTKYAAEQGVVLVLQNHADFIQTADDILSIVQQVNSDWLAVNLDIGSFKIGDPYAHIAKVAPYAATWQIKENVFVNGQEVATDLSRIMQIISQSGYRGYLPIETLGKGDPRVKVTAFYKKVRSAVETMG
ncbi:hypothetical protein GCM10027299_58600 [Larkinella ripae]